MEPTYLSSGMITPNLVGSTLSSIATFVHHHRRSVKTAQFATFILGLSILSSLPFIPSTIKIRAKVALALVGALLPLLSYISHTALKIIVPPIHDMRTKKFEEGTITGGSLSYEGLIPVLNLDYSKGPYLAGYAHGYLCGDAINHIVKRYDFVLHTLLRIPRTSQFSDSFFESLKNNIPPEYLLEMQGLLDGYTKWEESHPHQSPKKLNLNEILFLHLLPDIATLKLYKLTKDHQEKKSSFATIPQPIPLMGCAVRVERDSHGHLIFHRLLDWAAAGTGEYSLVIRRHYDDGRQNTHEAVFAGFCGTFTGMSTHLSLAMNVCLGKANVTKEGDKITFKGTPACFLNRKLLESCDNIEEVKKTSLQFPPFGPYHLTVVDRHTAAAIHFRQGPDQSDVYRHLQPNTPLIVLNCRYNETGPQPNTELSNDTKREAIIASYPTNQGALSCPEINGWMATHFVEMTLTKKSKPTISAIFGNGFLAIDKIISKRVS